MDRPVVLLLRIRIPAGTRDALITFLRTAARDYRSPGGIQVRLLQSTEDPNTFIEMIEYVDRQGYALDQHRSENDPHIRDHIARWRSLLIAPALVEVYEEVTAELDLHGGQQ